MTRKYIKQDEYRKLLKEGKEGVVKDQGLALVKTYDCKMESVGEGSRVRRFVASTGAVDREGDVIVPSGWKVGNWLKGGSFLWSHEWGTPPLGKPLQATVSEEALKVSIEFTPEDMGHPYGRGFGYEMMRMFDGGYLRGVSVGYSALKAELNDERDGFMPVDYLEQELLELSATPVPANPEALHEASASGINVGGLYNWAEETLKSCQGGELLIVPQKVAKDILDSYESVKAFGLITDNRKGMEMAENKKVEPKKAEPKEEKNLGVPSKGKEENPVVVAKDSVSDTPEGGTIETKGGKPMKVEEEKETPSLEELYTKTVEDAEAVEGSVITALEKFSGLLGAKGKLLSVDSEDKIRKVIDCLDSLLPKKEEGRKEVEHLDITIESLDKMIADAIGTEMAKITGRLPH